jgi:hypothetical protein
MLGFIFNKWIRNTYRGWWMRYNYLTSAALDVGLALCGLIIFFFVLLPGGKMPKYWGKSYMYELNVRQTLTSYLHLCRHRDRRKNC